MNKKNSMRIISLATIFILGIYSVNAQSNNNQKTMTDTKSTLRLIYPQWQGGGEAIKEFVPELEAKDASRGYYLGSHLLRFLAPNKEQRTAEVPVSLDIGNRTAKNGIISYDAIVQQTKDALAILNKENPKRIITLGGECSSSIVPFTYMASKYPDDVAIIWIDAHPDLGLPRDSYNGYHAMALSACLGLWEDEITKQLPAKIGASKALIVGLREWDTGIKERQQQLGVKGLAPSDVADNSIAVLKWLKGTGASKVVIHYDLDVLDPKEIVAAVGVIPNGLKINEVSRLISDIGAEYDIVSLTIAEPMPRTAIKIRNLLDNLPLLKD